jgi:peptidoglycan/LPS O-acetylase OafA/YrhL
MGLLRVFLAMAVLLYHAGGFLGYSPINGPLAVQGFFIISGFYMGLVLNERYDRPATNGMFWLNRGLRIYASYFAFLALYLTIYAIGSAFGHGSPLDVYASDAIPLYQRIYLGAINLTVVGQELPAYLAIADGHLVWSLTGAKLGPQAVYLYSIIPVSWSLSLELCFYAVAPYLARRRAWQIALLCAASFALRIWAVAAWSLDDAPFSDGFFPFELALFLAGILAYKLWAARRDAFDAPAWRAFALAVPLLAFAYPWLAGQASVYQFFVPVRMLFLLVLCAALPAIHGWSRHSRIDRTIGELSYPLYLVHWLILSLIPGGQGNPLRTLCVAATAIAVAWAVTRTVDDRIEAIRTKIRNRAQLCDDRQPVRELSGATPTPAIRG